MKKLLTVILCAGSVMAQVPVMNWAGHWNIVGNDGASRALSNVIVTGSSPAGTDAVIYGKASFSGTTYIYFWNSESERDAGDTTASSVIASVRSFSNAVGVRTLTLSQRNSSGYNISMQINGGVLTSEENGDFNVGLMNVTTTYVNQHIQAALDTSIIDTSYVKSLIHDSLTDGSGIWSAASVNTNQGIYLNQGDNTKAGRLSAADPGVSMDVWNGSSYSTKSIIDNLGITVFGNMSADTLSGVIHTNRSASVRSIVADTVTANSYFNPTYISNGSLLYKNSGQVNGFTCNVNEVPIYSSSGGNDLYAISAGSISLSYGGADGKFFYSLDNGGTQFYGASPWNQIITAVVLNGLNGVGGGIGGRLARTTNGGVSFDSVNSPSTKNIGAVAWDAINSQWIAVTSTSAGSPDVMTSPTGTTWTSRTYGTNISIRDVFAGDTILVTVGTSGTIKVSTTGVTWTSRTSGVATELTGASFSSSLHLWVAVGVSGVIRTSPDAVTWTGRTSGVATTLRRVWWDGTKFIAVGDAGVTLYSSNGTSWSAGTSGTTSILYGVTSKGDTDYAVGASGVHIRSMDHGATWSAFGSNAWTCINKDSIINGGTSTVGTGPIIRQNGASINADSVYSRVGVYRDRFRGDTVRVITVFKPKMITPGRMAYVGASDTGLTTLTSTGALCVARMNSGNTAAECAVSSGTGSPANTTGPSFSGFTNSSTSSQTGLAAFGLATTTPIISTSLLEAENNGTSSISIISHSSVPNPSLSGVGTGGTNSAPTATPDGGVIGGIAGFGYTNAYTSSSSARIRLMADGTWSNGVNQGTLIQFSGTPNGSTTVGEWGRFQRGAFLLGVTSVPSTVPSAAGNLNVSADYYRNGIIIDTTGSWTAAISGCTSGGTGTATASRSGGNIVYRIPALSCTSNSTSLTLTGMPLSFAPAATTTCLVTTVQDNTTTTVSGKADIGTNGVWTISMITQAALVQTINATFTASNTKGVSSINCSGVR